METGCGGLFHGGVGIRRRDDGKLQREHRDLDDDLLTLHPPVMEARVLARVVQTRGGAGKISLQRRGVLRHGQIPGAAPRHGDVVTDGEALNVEGFLLGDGEVGGADDGVAFREDVEVGVDAFGGRAAAVPAKVLSRVADVGRRGREIAADGCEGFGHAQHTAAPLGVEAFLGG